MKEILILLSLFLFVISCNEHRTDTKLPKKKTVLKSIPKIDKGPVEFKGLIDVQSLDSTIYVDMKYATTNNFMGFQLYKTIKRPYLQPDVAQRVVKCQEFLSAIDSSLHLLIYDAARPVSVQKLMWEALDSLPPVLRGRYVSNPYHRSLHNLGAAIDVTLCHADGVPLDMGADFDEFREIAYPRLEFRFLKTGELSQQQYENRLLLRRVMKSQRFRQLPTEWWHYNAYSRDVARTKYSVLKEEPDLSLKN